MNIALSNPATPDRQAVENIRQELYRLYWQAFGKEPAPEVLRAEAEDFVAKYGPEADLSELFHL